MKKLAFYLINLVLATSVYAAPTPKLISLDKRCIDLTKNELKRIKSVIEESALKKESKKNLIEALEVLIDTKKSNFAQEKLAQIQPMKISALFVVPLGEMDKQGKALGSDPEAMVHHCKNKAQLVQSLAKLIFNDTSKPCVIQIKTPIPIRLAYIPEETLFFQEEKLSQDFVVDTLALTEDKNSTQFKLYPVHDNKIETRRNSLVLRKKAIPMGKNGEEYEFDDQYLLISGTENTPADMLPHAFDAIKYVDIFECTKQAIESNMRSLDLTKLLLEEDMKLLSEKAVKEGRLDVSEIIDQMSSKLATLILSDNPLPVERSELLKDLNASAIKQLIQKFKAQNERYAFVKTLFEPLIEEKPEAKDLIITLPNLHNPLERNTLLLSYLFSEIKQLREMAPEAPEVQSIIEQQIEKLQAAAQEQTQAIETCLRQEEEQKVRTHVQERSVPAPKEKPKPAKKLKKKDLIIASNTKPSEISEEEKQLEKMKAVIDTVVEKKLKGIVEDCNHKPNAIVRKLGEFCKNFGVAMGLDSGKGSHAKLQFGDDVGSVVVPMHEELKQGTAGAVVNQLTLAITKRIGLQNATLDALKNVATTLRLETTPSK